jgi:two-component sensor histidine kinase
MNLFVILGLSIGFFWGDNGTGMPEGLDFRNTETPGLRIVTTLSKISFGVK